MKRPTRGCELKLRIESETKWRMHFRTDSKKVSDGYSSVKCGDAKNISANE